MLALTHAPSPNLEQCQRTYVAPAPIAYGLAVRQHEAYCRMLRRSGADVLTLDVNRGLPDSVIIEDTAVVLDEETRRRGNQPTPGPRPRLWPGRPRRLDATTPSSHFPSLN